MTKKFKKPDVEPEAVEYRIFNLPRFGRVRAPVDMTEASLIAALSEEDADE